METKVKKAIILAAGKGNRLYPLTNNIPKPLTKLGTQSIINNLVKNLIRVGIKNIAVVTGYMGDKISLNLCKDFSDVNFSFIHNDLYDTTNNIYSLWLAKDHFSEDFLLLEAEIFCKPEIINQLMVGPVDSSACLVSPKEYYMDGSCVKLKNIPLCITELKKFSVAVSATDYYKTVNFYRISGKFASGWLYFQLEKAVSDNNLSGYYEDLFSQAISENENQFLACIVNQNDWFEIDNLDDLDIANFRLKSPLERQRQLEYQHGGIWRYPVTDHCFLYNFHYPPKNLLDHISIRLDKLIREYPSGQDTLTKYLSSYYDIDNTSLVVSNGVSEIISLLFTNLEKKVLIPTPSFNEYESAIPSKFLRRFNLLWEENFTLDPEKLLHDAEVSDVGHILIISPNNPTRNAVPREDLEKIIIEANKKGINIILDESFVDFHPKGRDASLLNEIHKYKNLTIVFSLSKSHGIGGIRLGMLASGDSNLVNEIRSKIPIWNINSFAEEYLRIFSSYRKEFEISCIKVREEVFSLRKKLNKIPGLSVFPSDANFLFCKIDKQLGTAEKLVTTLIEEDNIFIKDCSGKSMPDSKQYFRVSSRNEKENELLYLAITRVFKKRSESVKF